jgi:hypothetical protein
MKPTTPPFVRTPDASFDDLADFGPPAAWWAIALIGPSPRSCAFIRLLDGAGPEG